MTAAYDEAREQLRRQERLLAAIERFYVAQERATGRRWSDATLSVRVGSSTFMAQLRAGRFVRPQDCDAAEEEMERERAKWAKARRARA